MSVIIVISGILIVTTAAELWYVFSDISRENAERRRAIHRRSHLETGYYGARFEAAMRGTKC